MVRVAAQIEAGESLPSRVDADVKTDRAAQAVAGLYREFAVVGPDAARADPVFCFASMTTVWDSRRRRHGDSRLGSAATATVGGVKSQAPPDLAKRPVMKSSVYPRCHPPRARRI
ncbi:MAG: hypothetical protein IPI02_20820 [Sterolibacteriaceae bacterium]|nr:hypothetical protein [Sterolibacteriaceae bacterium]